MSEMLCIPWAGLHWSELWHSARCPLNPPGWFCWLFCDRVLLLPLVLSTYGPTQRKLKWTGFYCFVFLISVFSCPVLKMSDTVDSKEQTGNVFGGGTKKPPHNLSLNTNLSLSHDQSEDRVRPGAFVIHACSRSSSLFISELKPGLKENMGE